MHDERRAAARGVGRAHAAAVGVDDARHDRQPEAGASGATLAAALGAPEALEQRVGLVGGQPGAVVAATAHGPVTGYGTVAGRKFALAQLRSTRGRELRAALDVYRITTGRTTSPQQFVSDLEKFEMTFNGFYVDSKHTAYVSTGRLPVRAAGVDPGLPTVGTGQYDWTGFLGPAAHPHAIDPERIRNITIVRTVVGGAVVYDA